MRMQQFEALRVPGPLQEEKEKCHRLKERGESLKKKKTKIVTCSVRMQSRQWC